MRLLRRNSVKILLLLIFAIILCSYPLNTTAQVRTFTHNEEKDYGPTSLVRMWDARAFDDGTVVMRVVRANANSTTPTGICLYQMLSFRIINPNGTVVEKDFDFGFQPFNYCVSKRGIMFLDFIGFDIIRQNQIFVRYYNATDLSDINTYSELGMIIDLDGNILGRTNFGPAFVDPTSKQIVPISRYRLNINREKGFLRFINKSNSLNNLEWQQYKIEADGSFTLLIVGNLEFGNFTGLSIIAMQTIDEGYAIAFANSTSTNTFNATNPLLPQGQLFVLPIGFNQTSVSPLLLYQTPIPVTFPAIFCNVATVGVGQVCTLTAQQSTGTTPAGTTPPAGTAPGTTPSEKYFYIKVNFLSSGSVTSFQVINRLLPVDNTRPIWVVNNLPFGGYFLSNTIPPTTQSPDSFLVGYIFDESNENSSWTFPQPQKINNVGLFIILPNNTLLVAQRETGNFWQLQAIDLPKLYGDRDKGYSNLNVESTDPSIQSTINPNLDKVTINFYNQVELSDGKLSVYQVIDNQNYLRQSIPGSLCSIGNDSRSVSVKMLGSTFSTPNGNYFITLENNFVKDKSFKEPLLGIKNNVWTITTSEKKVPFSPAATGLLRLSLDGTQHFDSLPSEQQTNFFNSLLDDLSLAVPIRRARLSSNGRTQLDTNVNDRQYLISVGIKETRDNNDISVNTAIDNLNAMVTNKDQTPIGLGPTSRYLDGKYGFVPSPNLWEKYKFRLLGVFLIVGLLMVLFLFAQRRDSNGHNIAILQLGLIIFDLVMDILFVSSNAKDVPFLYIPSVIFVTIPIALNTSLAFTIITQENSRPEFVKWFTNHGKVASVFTVLSGADIEALNILHSNLAGFPFFRAPFSDRAKDKIFWGACLNIFTEDIPQVIVQVLYRYNTVSYDNLIPLLTLVSSAVNLTINIIGRLYQATNRLRKRHHKGEPIIDGSNKDDPFDFDNSERGESLTREVPQTESSSQNYLGDIKLGNNDEKLGLDAVLNKSYNDSNKNLGDDLNKDQSSKGMSTFLKRMVSKKE